MALFSKPPARKPPTTAPGHERAGRAPSARDLAARADGSREKPRLEPVRADESVTGASLVEWSSQQQAIEVAQANPGLCAVLENAALLFASGQTQAARALLEQGVAEDHETKHSPLAWLALLDLVQRSGDRALFEQYAVSYSVEFERSAPMWEERAQTKAPAAAPAGYLAITGPLAVDAAAQIDGVRRAVARKVAHARLDLGSVTGFDDAGAKLLAAALSEARRAGLGLTIERAQKLNAALDAATRQGRDGGDGAWLLTLELLQWTGDQAAFDERAIEYAIAFEVSPPSWEPPAEPSSAGESPPPKAPQDEESADHADAVQLAGVIVGQSSAQLATVQDFAHGRQVVPVDMTGVERIDFVCAGAFLNTVSRIENQRKSVHIVGASPIIRALLLLIGLSPRHFVKKDV